MATVAVSFTPLPAHVRTARFIAATVARRAGVAETVLDEVRLAVSEACSLAVRQHRVHAPDVPVELRLTDDDKQFSIEVADSVSRTQPDDSDESPLELDDSEMGSLSSLSLSHDPQAATGDLRARERIGLAVIDGLVDDFKVEYLDAGSIVTMRWPIVGETASDARVGGVSLL